MSILEITVIALIKIILIVSIVFLTVAYLVYFERKISAWAQNRLGPNRVGWRGALQPFADVAKLLLKEDIVPSESEKRIHTLAPFITLFIAFSTYAVIPIGPDITVFGYTTSLVVADVNIGILYVLALTSLGVYGLTLSRLVIRKQIFFTWRYQIIRSNDFVRSINGFLNCRCCTDGWFT
ncbi:MAG: complex I subunit 1 family protein [Melioribacteraceae bacterium]|nr:complex I subunit 1 family protein [Melioribacteraceae bacterium]